MLNPTETTRTSIIDSYQGIALAMTIPQAASTGFKPLWRHRQRLKPVDCSSALRHAWKACPDTNLYAEKERFSRSRSIGCSTQ